jgi:hypothetical protein
VPSGAVSRSPPGSNGPVTSASATPARTPSSRAVIRAWSRAIPPGSANTICACVPAWPAKPAAVSTSNARCDSESGREKSSLVSPAKAPPRTFSPASSTIQATTTRRRER